MRQFLPFSILGLDGDGPSDVLENYVHLWFVPTNTFPEMWSCVVSVIAACQRMRELPNASHSAQTSVCTLLGSQTHRAGNGRGNSKTMKMRGLQEVWSEKQEWKRERETIFGCHEWQRKILVRGEISKEDSEDVFCVMWAFWENLNHFCKELENNLCNSIL